ncbi:MAG: MATE family efflux transporter [Clostridia bacterium]|nr:MATE family efflux transporter [Clostridia bacterium]
MKSKNVDMLHGNITKGVLMMTMPIMLQCVLQTLFGVLDMSVLGYYANDTAVGAVGACGTLTTLCTSLLFGCSVGANVIVARHIGEGDRSKTNDAINTALAFALAGGVLLLLIGLFFAKTFLQWTNCPESLLPGAVRYFKIYFLGAPVLMLYNTFASILRACGDSRRPMYYSITGGVVKIGLNFLCVAVLNTTVEGVAIATIASNLVAGGLCYITLKRSHKNFDFNLRSMRFKKEELKKILHVGIPSGLQTSLYSFANVIIATAVNGLGPNATTGISIANQFDGILYQVIHSPGVAAISYVAQNVGAQKLDRVKKSIYSSCFVSVIFGASLGALSAIFSGELSSIMTRTPEVIAYSRQKMLIISSTYFICGINEVMGAALKGMGKPIIPTVATLVFMCLLRFVWVYGLYYPLFEGNLTFLYLVWPVGWILSIATLGVAYIFAMKKLRMQSPLQN